MSPLDPIKRLLPRWRRPIEYLRVGRHAVERWSAPHPAHGLQLQASAPLPRGPAPRAADLAGGLTNAIAQLYPKPLGTRVEAVLESAWLPVMRVETGGTLLSDTQAQALVRHRLQRLYDTARDPVAGWDVRVDFRAGDAQALGYGLSPQIHQALQQAASRAGFKWRAITPAWCWGWDRAWQRSTRHATGLSGKADGWWGWLEQDRLMLAHVARAEDSPVPRLASLHAGLAPDLNARDLRRQIDIAAIGLGLVDASGSICIAAWTPAPAGLEDAGLRWLCVDGRPPTHQSRAATAGRLEASRNQAT